MVMKVFDRDMICAKIVKKFGFFDESEDAWMDGVQIKDVLDFIEQEFFEN